MSVTIYFFLAIAALVLFSAIAIITELKTTHRYLFTGRNIFIFGISFSATLLMIPIYAFESGHWIFSVIASILHIMSLFFFKPNFEKIIDLWRSFPLYYMITISAYHLITPMISTAVILSFVKHFAAFVKYKFCFNKDVHVFSELNEKTLALGKNLYEKHNGPKREKGSKKIAIIYTDVIYANDEAHMDLIEGAKEIKAILFNKDILSINFKRTEKSRRNIKFYLISDDEREKVKHLDRLIELYEHNENAELYIFSDSIEVKCFLNKCLENKRNPKTKMPEINMRVLRVDDIKILIYHSLDENGLSLFKNAALLEDGTREISVAVIGFGKYGQEVTKALLWYCQIPGFRVKISVLDERVTTESEFRAMCPEIRVNEDVNDPNDMHYTLHFSYATFGTEEFYSELEKVGVISHAFVCLGDDSRNITAAVGIKERLSQQTAPLYIETIIYDPCLKNCFSDNVRAFGDLQSFYSKNSVIAGDLINEGLNVHLRWASNPDDPAEKTVFHMSDYNYYSSLASALHRRLIKKVKNNPDCFAFYEFDPLAQEILPRLDDNEHLKALSGEMRTFADCLYIRIAYQKYRNLECKERKTVLDRLQNKISQNNSDIVMLFSDQNVTEKYKECLKNIQFDENAKDIVKLLRKILDCMIEIQSENIKDPNEKHKVALTFEWDALPENVQSDILNYIDEKLDISPEESMLYFKKARWFANLEHIRWNAYMRTEGFRLSAKTDKANKFHFDLVPSNYLTFADCIKDI